MLRFGESMTSKLLYFSRLFLNVDGKTIDLSNLAGFLVKKLGREERDEWIAYLYSHSPSLRHISALIHRNLIPSGAWQDTAVNAVLERGDVFLWNEFIQVFKEVLPKQSLSKFLDAQQGMTEFDNLVEQWNWRKYV